MYFYGRFTFYTLREVYLCMVTLIGTVRKTDNTESTTVRYITRNRDGISTELGTTRTDTSNKIRWYDLDSHLPRSSTDKLCSITVCDDMSIVELATLYYEKSK